MLRKKRKPPSRQIEFFVADLADLLSAGIDLNQSLDSLALVAPKRYGWAKQMKDSISRGQAVEEVFERAGFPEVAVSFLRVGLVTGELDQAFQSLTLYFNHRRLRREKLGKMLSYPILLMFLSLVSMYMMAWQVIPHFLKFYHSLNLAIPRQVQVVMMLANVVVMSLPYTILLVGGLVVLFWWKRDRWLIRVEKRVVRHSWGAWLRILKAMQNFETLSALLGAGVDLLTAIEVMISTNTARMRCEWTTIFHAVGKGTTLSHALRLTPYFPELAASMLTIAEQTGDLEGGAKRLKNYYERSFDRTVERLFSFFEPASLFILGVMIGGVTLVLLLPMTDLVKQLS